MGPHLDAAGAWSWPRGANPRQHHAAWEDADAGEPSGRGLLRASNVARGRVRGEAQVPRTRQRDGVGILDGPPCLLGEAAEGVVARGRGLVLQVRGLVVEEKHGSHRSMPGKVLVGTGRIPRVVAAVPSCLSYLNGLFGLAWGSVPVKSCRICTANAECQLANSRPRAWGRTY